MYFMQGFTDKHSGIPDPWLHAYPYFSWIFILRNVPDILMFQKDINQNIPGRNFIFFYPNENGKLYN